MIVSSDDGYENEDDSGHESQYVMNLVVDAHYIEIEDFRRYAVDWLKHPPWTLYG